MWLEMGLPISPSVPPDLEALHKEHSAKGYEVTRQNGLPGTAPNYYFVKGP